jgi:3-deoxy-manno-octulosonate cytidylyltransferase (CMP-KDO synthetase)
MNAKVKKMLQNDEILGIIPARMASSRFPGKPVVEIGGVPMVIRVYRQASEVLRNLVIASGDAEIEAVARKYGADFILTRGDHLTGTSRCIEAAGAWSAKTGLPCKAVLNIQGDEPMVTAAAVSLLADDIRRPDARISTLIRRENDPVAFANPNRVKVVTDRSGNALYFSRSPIPFYRTAGTSWYSHVGMYAFRREVLESTRLLEPGRLETAESLEQLRWLENGIPVHCCETDYSGFGIDTPEDLAALLKSGWI